MNDPMNSDLGNDDSDPMNNGGDDDFDGMNDGGPAGFDPMNDDPMNDKDENATQTHRTCRR
jgi:hypothetical protein